MSPHAARGAASKDDKPSASSTTSKKRSRAAENGDDSKPEPRRSARTAGDAVKETSDQPSGKKKRSTAPVSAKQSKTKSTAKTANGKAEDEVDDADDAADDGEEDKKPPPGERASKFDEVTHTNVIGALKLYADVV